MQQEPVQFKLSGGVADENEMKPLLSSVLSTLDGEAGIIAYAVHLNDCYCGRSIGEEQSNLYVKAFIKSTQASEPKK